MAPGPRGDCIRTDVASPRWSADAEWQRRISIAADDNGSGLMGGTVFRPKTESALPAVRGADLEVAPVAPVGGSREARSLGLWFGHGRIRSMRSTISLS